MRLDRFVPERFRRLIHEALKFGAVGGINAVINFAVFNALILTLFAQSQLKANVIATVVATTASYLMNRHWTFRHRSRSAMHREYVLFFLLNGVGLVIELAVLGAAKYGFALTSILALNIAKIIGVGFGTVFRFWAYRSFVFRALPEPEESVAAAEAALAGVPGPVALAGHEPDPPKQATVTPRQATAGSRANGHAPVGLSHGPDLAGHADRPQAYRARPARRGDAGADVTAVAELDRKADPLPTARRR
ncbi:MAG TPA: GtrA family protein [Micromonosporaceae bacterium]|nr:GtrA family protein [Micromonosporaceae bacterium]